MDHSTSSDQPTDCRRDDAPFAMSATVTYATAQNMARLWQPSKPNALSCCGSRVGSIQKHAGASAWRCFGGLPLNGKSFTERSPLRAEWLISGGHGYDF